MDPGPPAIRFARADTVPPGPTPGEYRVGVRARAPASSANLGPGFDTLAIALDRYVEVEVEPAPELIVRSEGEGAGLSDDPSHLAARVAIDVAGTDHLSITVRSQIPIARGLGSSAALAVAAAAAAGAEDPLAVAAQMDGHPDNAAASMVGGLVAAARVKGGVQAVRLPLDVSLAFVVIVPEVTLSTARARQAPPHRGEPGERGVQPVADGPPHRRPGRQPAPDPRGHRGPAAPGLPQPALSGRPEAVGRDVRRGGAGRVLVRGRALAARDLPRHRGPHGAGGGGGGPGRGRHPGEVLVLHPDMHGLIVDREGSADVFDFNADD